MLITIRKKKLMIYLHSFTKAITIITCYHKPI